MKFIGNADFTQNLSEVGQNREIRYSLAKQLDGGVWKNYSPWMMCRDYLSDIIYCQNNHYDQEFRQYGFSWAYDADFEETLQSGRFHLALGSQQTPSEMIWDIYKNRKILYTLDAEFGMKRTIVRIMDVEWEDFFPPGSDVPRKYVYAKDKVIVLSLDSAWMNNSVIMSLYSLMIRLLANKFPKHVTHYTDVLNYLMYDFEFRKHARREAGLIAGVMKDPEMFHFFIKNWKRVLGDAPIEVPFTKADLGQYESLSTTVHNHSGIASMMHGLRMAEEKNMAKPLKNWILALKEIYRVEVVKLDGSNF